MSATATRGEIDVPAAGTRSPVPILMVDDNPAKRLALKAVLAPLGFSIVEADSGVAALRCVMEQDFAAILIDVVMPLMDGFETAASIRQRRQSEMTPIIFITARGQDEITNPDLYAEGAVDFIFAPVPPHELRAKVSVFANLFLRAQGLAAEARDVRISADRLRQVSGGALLTVMNGLLDLPDARAGVDEVEFNPRSIVEEVVDLLAEAARTKGLDLRAAIEGPVRATVSGDPERVRQLLINLIADAITFTQTGEIVARVTEPEAADGEDPVVRFEVSASGDGVDPDKLVALIGADCGGSSRPGQGSRLWFTIAARGSHSAG